MTHHLWLPSYHLFTRARGTCANCRIALDDLAVIGTAAAHTPKDAHTTICLWMHGYVCGCMHTCVDACIRAQPSVYGCVHTCTPICLWMHAYFCTGVVWVWACAIPSHYRHTLSLCSYRHFHPFLSLKKKFFQIPFLTMSHPQSVRFSFLVLHSSLCCLLSTCAALGGFPHDD